MEGEGGEDGFLGRNGRRHGIHSEVLYDFLEAEDLGLRHLHGYNVES